MKKAEIGADDELRPEYDLSQLKGRVRGRYAERYRAGTNLVLLEPDVAAAFPDAKAVNEALRALIKDAEARPATPNHAQRHETAGMFVSLPVI